MHLIVIFLALSSALAIRSINPLKTGLWIERWWRALLQFLVPPLLLIVTAITILWMGNEGQMFGQPVGQISYLLAIVFLGWIGISGAILTAQGWKSWQKIQTYPQINLHNQSARLIASPVLFSAQIGFWKPKLVVTQGLLNTLTPEQLQAVLTHENAHAYYRDTFWFFGLAWLKSITAFLPQTETLWQELLTLREVRADHWATQQSDPLLLAETLLFVVSQPLSQSDIFSAAFYGKSPSNRLSERIDALLDKTPISTQPNYQFWGWMLLSLLPLALIPLHH